MSTMKRLLFNLWCWPLFGVVTFIAVLLAPLLLAGNALLFRYPVDRGVRIGIRLYGRVLIHLVQWLMPVTVDDRSGGVPRPAIFVANHYSSIDPYLFGLLPYEMAFVTSWPFRIPIYRWFMALAGYINRGDGWEAMERDGKALLASGCSLIVWPEGHRSRDGQLQRFRNGAFRLAVRSGMPIVPVCIVGSDRLLPPGRRFLTPCTINMTLLPPIILPTEGEGEMALARRLREAARGAIRSELVRQTASPATTRAGRRVARTPSSVMEIGSHE